MSRLATWLVAALALLPPFPATAQELGRLFLTPEQRATLDARRKARVPDKPAAVAGPALVTPVSRIDGYVQRSGGKSTVWVNGQAVPESAREPGARLQSSGVTGVPSVAIHGGDGGVETRARAGQSVDTTTGAVQDPLGDGEIRVKRPAPPREGRPR